MYSHKIYINTGKFFYSRLLSDHQTGFWIAREIECKGFYNDPIEEILSAFLQKDDSKGLNVINISMKDAFLSLFFSKYYADKYNLIKLVYPSTFSFQVNRTAIFTIIISSLALSVSIFPLLRDTFRFDISTMLFICSSLFLILLIIGLFISIRPSITETYDVTKFNIEIAANNYAKIISKKLKTSDSTAIVFVIKTSDLLNTEKIIQLFKDLPKLYKILIDKIGIRFRLVVEINPDKLSKVNGDTLQNDYEVF